MKKPINAIKIKMFVLFCLPFLLTACSTVAAVSAVSRIALGGDILPHDIFSLDGDDSENENSESVLPQDENQQHKELN